MTKVVLDVPKIKQLRYHCGPASLAMVFQYNGYGNTQEDIAKWFDYDLDETGGICLYDLVHCARAHGAIAHPRQNLGLAGIMRSIDKGLPLIARVLHEDYTHFVVVKGYETKPNIIWVNDPDRLTEDRMLYENFAKRWTIRRKEGGTNQYGLIIRE